MQSDEDFLGYVYFHCRTPRRLFHRDDVNRLLKLAGYDELSNLPQFLSVDEEQAEHCIARYRSLQKSSDEVPPESGVRTV